MAHPTAAEERHLHAKRDEIEIDANNAIADPSRSSGSGDDANPHSAPLHRKPKSLHLQMIAPGDDPAGEIARLMSNFVSKGSSDRASSSALANALHKGGPERVLIRFSPMGIIVFFVIFVIYGTPLKQKTSDLEIELFISRQSSAKWKPLSP
jgi:hypothetical protein